MKAIFQQLDDYIKDIAIVHRKIAVCFNSREPEFLEGNVDEIVFGSEMFSTVIICSNPRQQRIIYSMILNHKLYKELQLMARTRHIPTKHYDS